MTINTIVCEEGIAYIALYNGQIIISGSLTSANYWECNLTFSSKIDITQYTKDIEILEEVDPADLVLKADLISNNSICLRLFKRDDVCGTEENAIRYKIKERCLQNIAKSVIDKYNNSIRQ